ncbi:MAG: heat-shock protein [Campylobacterota bacterium]|nr:heat-shock protein [Campylobacterota bacterium]
MIDKKEFLLQSIIRAYIEHMEPIGSTQLKNMYDIAYSPATIRGYFKKLGDDGYLAQEHISSGRVPTIEALKEYWSSRLNFELDEIDFEMITRVSSQIGATVFIKQNDETTLQEILNIDDRYMILEFNNFSITVKFSAPLFKFLQDMRGLELENILDVSKQVGAVELYNELGNKISNSAYEVINMKSFLRMAVEYDMREELIQDFLHGQILEKLQSGIYFEQLLPVGYMGVCHDCKINGVNIKMLVVGELSKDYDYFYKGVTR